ncbi:MAG TPA: hypothetical protein VFY84_09125 [Jiangellales bacterium]|nr:hypothetical protein [Jiangellales bacterium]
MIAVATLPLVEGTAEAPAAPPVPQSAGEPESPSPEQIALLLRDALAQAVATHAPDAHWLPDGQPPVIAPEPAPAAEPSVCVAAGGCLAAGTAIFSGHADIARAENTGWVGLAIHTADPTILNCAGDVDGCVAGLSPHGATMVTRSITPTANPNAMTGPVLMTTRLVAIELPGGQILELTVNRSKYPDDESDLVLTEAELILIADDIASLIGDSL